MIFNFVAAVLLLASVAQSLIINTPANGAVVAVGSPFNLSISNDTAEDATTANVVFTAQNGITYTVAVTGIPTAGEGSTTQSVTLPATFNSGLASVVATATDGTAAAATNFIQVNNPVVPVVPTPFNPYIFPCYRPYNPCYNPCRKPVCNVPRPRCRIRGSSPQDQSNIVFSGFSIYMNDNGEQVEQFEQALEMTPEQLLQEQANAQLQQEMQAQFEQQVMEHMEQQAIEA